MTMNYLIITRCVDMGNYNSNIIIIDNDDNSNMGIEDYDRNIIDIDTKVAGSI